MKRICINCGRLVEKCEQCPCQVERTKARQAVADAKRPNAAQRGYTAEWAKAAKAFLALPGNELCAICKRAPACLVDHIKAHKGDMRLFWDPANWQPSCKPCNSRKNVRQEGGFGRSV